MDSRQINFGLFRSKKTSVGPNRQMTTQIATRPSLKGMKNSQQRKFCLQVAGSERSGPVIGIDLGTTNSCVAYMEGTDIKVCENSEGMRTTPSVVAFTENGERLVGLPARRQAATNAENTIFAAKRLIGTQFADPKVQKQSQLVPYKIVKADNSGDAWIQVRGKKYAPSEIGAMVLTKMKETAETTYGSPITHAVITVPAHFNDAQRQATKDAGRICGLHVERCINEPTAASLAFGVQNATGDKTVVVYDLGGGTFDVSILKLSGGKFEVKSTGGDTFLGGEDFDIVIQNHMIEYMKKKNKVDVKEDIIALQRLREAAEKAKKELDSAESTEINLPYLTAVNGNAVHFQMNLTKKVITALTEKIISKSMKPVAAVLADAGYKKEDIDDVLLVGGMTRMPQVQKAVEDYFGKKPAKNVNPDEAVAIGAAIQGSVLVGQVQGLVLMDVTPLSLGLETVGGVMTKIIPRNTTIPVRESKTFTTSADFQTEVEVKVYQGERELVAQNKLLGKFTMTGIPPARKGVPQIDVTFDIDGSGIVSVSAKDKATGKEQNIRIQSDGGLSAEEIEAMKKDAELHAEEDSKRREQTETRNQVENVCFEIQKSIESSNISQENRSKLQEAIDNLKQLSNDADADPDKLKEELDHVKNLSMDILSEAYNNAANQ